MEKKILKNKKGFSLTEIIAVIVIVGVLAVVAISNYITLVEQGMAQNAEHNILTIIEAEKTYWFNHEDYCRDLTGCGVSLSALNTNLNLKIQDENYNYVCWYIRPTIHRLLCTAYRNNNTDTNVNMPNGPVIVYDANNNTAIQCYGSAAWSGGTFTASNPGVAYCPPVPVH